MRRCLCRWGRGREEESMVLEDKTGSVLSVRDIGGGGAGRRRLGVEVWSSDKRSGLEIEI